MPKLSLWRNEKSNNYRFLDRIIREQYTVGGLDIHIHKYLGPKTTATPSGDATLPTYTETNPLFVEDLLLLENRNRAYEPDIYTMRGVYRVQDIDFDLTQFGLFLQNDTLFITFHYNDMIDFFGRKLMAGDVLEIPNLKDYNPLDETIPLPLPRFYVIQDADYASEGFSATWLPHIWRVKATPLVGSQEYQDILNQYIDTQGGIDGTDGAGNGSGTLKDYIATCAKNLDLNSAIIASAEIEVPLSGYDVSSFYIVQYNANGDPINLTYVSVDMTSITADSTILTVDRGAGVPAFGTTADNNTILVSINTLTVDSTVSGLQDIISPDPSGQSLQLGYLTGDGIPPNGFPAVPATAFPTNPKVGDYVLRLDYHPNRLFRYNGNIWVWIEDDVRTNLYLNGATERSNFVNNTTVVNTADRGPVPSRQALSDLLRPKKDN